MQDRYALRFESGERRGELVPIARGGLSLGRRPGSTVQLVDASVSGRHAEVTLDEEGALLRDLGSTNGTRVGGERISEHRLKHGDAILFGNVRMTFVDRQAAAPSGTRAEGAAGDIELEFGDAPRAPAGLSATKIAAAGLGDGVHQIAADKVARSRTKPVAALLGVLVLAACLGGAWWFLRRPTRHTERAPVAVEPVAGNLLSASYSFEESRGGWEGDARSPAGFESDPVARRSGSVGLRAELESGASSESGAGDWALELSPAVRIQGGRALRLSAWAQVHDGGRARVGLELSSSQGAAATTRAFGAVLTDAQGELALDVDVGPAYDTARAMVLATLAPGAARGAVDVDDVALVPAASPPERPKREEIELFLAGSSAQVWRIDRALLSDLRVADGTASAPYAPQEALSARASEVGLELTLRPPSATTGAGPRTLTFFVEPQLAAGGLASTGAGGYRTHQLEFERVQTSALMLGTGRDLIRLAFDPPASVRGLPENGGFRVEVALADQSTLGLQLSFRSERDAAEALARSARQAESDGQAGAALAAWQRLLDELPFEEKLLAEANAARARLEQSGQAALRAVRESFERARFFRLRDIYRECLDAAGGIAQRFATAPIAAEASALSAQIQGELSAIEVDLDAREQGRLAAIEAALRANGSAKLAGRVHERLAQRLARAQALAAPATSGSEAR